ncbi:MAG: DNA-binding response regulator [Bacteroidetes bacterium]|nr:MAG: DNA-binding response regulator [Bacteroidota bacterium]
MAAFQDLHFKELKLSSFTLDNLQEAVLWIASDGTILEVNEKTCELSGYTRDELTQMNILQLNPTEFVADFPAYWQKLKEAKHLIFESKHKHKSGYTYDVEIRGNYIEYNGAEISCSVVTDIRKRKLEQELLRTISERTAGLTGQDYFHELTRFVTSTLGVRYAIVTECSDITNTRVRTLSYVDNQQLLENIEYDIAGLPCEVLMRGKDLFCPVDLEKLFPAEKGIESYVGVPIYSPSSKSIIGHIAAFDRVPMRDDQNQTDILRIFAARAGAEIERLDALKKLQLANEQLLVQIHEIEDLKNQLQAENIYLQEEIRLNHNFEDIISISKKFQKVLRQIEQVAETDATVLITGESGTGKELIARAIHNISNRRRKPLVKVNCAALPATLIESELFGHERGAFTGAMERKIGRFELADGGTIFLDEIGELPLELQAKLLRILQEGEFERLGNPKTMKVNVRVLAATNRNLESAIEKSEFRPDLFYRLNVFPIFCPPLRDRKEDIPFLIRHFCVKHESKIGKKVSAIPSKVMDALTTYDWPGNIRELENIIERAMILSRNGSIEYGDWIPMAKEIKSAKNKLLRLDDVERQHILEVLKQTNWKVSGDKGAAKILGLNATTLEARMKKLGIKREQ